ncbi:MAG: hypothetical protein K2N72_05570 [Oscillospiraceae bacterium]|nr:hypothetical protein [Oscillospiraceae bacterium]
MKIKKKAAIAAAVFAVAMNFNGCGTYGPPTTESNDFDPGYNYNENVYGPPEGEWEDETTEESGADESPDITEDTNENSEENADE